MSYTVVNSKKVLESAINVINRINDYRRMRDEVTISETMKKKKGFFSNRRNLTREEAIEYLDARGDFLGWRSYYAWGTLERVEKLKILALNGNPVTITAEDAQLLWG